MEYLIVGLGNPGEQYEGTRHNIGARVVEELRIAQGLPEWQKSKRGRTLYSKGMIGQHKVELLLPQTYMNNSGEAVAYAKREHNIQSENIIIVHDDIDLPFGSIKILFNRGTGGHNGLESIAKHVGSDTLRVRFGIAPTHPLTGEDAVAKFVLKKFSILRERAKVGASVSRAVDAITALVERGRDVAMNEYN